MNILTPVTVWVREQHETKEGNEREARRGGREGHHPV